MVPGTVDVSAMIAAALFLKRDMSGMAAGIAFAMEEGCFALGDSFAPTGMAGRKLAQHASPQSSFGPILISDAARMSRRRHGSLCPAPSLTVSRPQQICTFRHEGGVTAKA
jgi:hypothetical protein